MPIEMVKIVREYHHNPAGQATYQRVYIPFEWVKSLGCTEGDQIRIKLDETEKSITLTKVE